MFWRDCIDCIKIAGLCWECKDCKNLTFSSSLHPFALFLGPPWELLGMSLLRWIYKLRPLVLPVHSYSRNCKDRDSNLCSWGEGGRADLSCLWCDRAVMIKELLGIPSLFYCIYSELIFGATGATGGRVKFLSAVYFFFRKKPNCAEILPENNVIVIVFVKINNFASYCVVIWEMRT